MVHRAPAHHALAAKEVVASIRWLIAPRSPRQAKHWLPTSRHRRVLICINRSFSSTTHTALMSPLCYPTLLPVVLFFRSILSSIQKINICWAVETMCNSCCSYLKYPTIPCKTAQLQPHSKHNFGVSPRLIGKCKV